jgi:hypothetical protein
MELTEEQLSAIVATAVKAAFAAVGEPQPTRKTIVRKANGQEHARETVDKGFNALSDADLDDYLMTVYAARDKDAGVFFYGCAPVWSMMLRRAYRKQPLSPKQFAWIRKLFANDTRNLACLRDKYPMIRADLARRKLTPQQIVDTAEETRRNNATARKALLT